jgi:hypothetical protein
MSDLQIHILKYNLENYRKRVGGGYGALQHLEISKVKVLDFLGSNEE